MLPFFVRTAYCHYLLSSSSLVRVRAAMLSSPNTKILSLQNITKFFMVKNSKKVEGEPVGGGRWEVGSGRWDVGCDRQRMIV